MSEYRGLSLAAAAMAALENGGLSKPKIHSGEFVTSGSHVSAYRLRFGVCSVLVGAALTIVGGGNSPSVATVDDAIVGKCTNCTGCTRSVEGNILTGRPRLGFETFFTAVCIDFLSLFLPDFGFSGVF